MREMDTIEEDFYTTSEAAREYLESRKGENSSVSSDILSIDLLERMNLSDHSMTHRKEQSAPIQQHKLSPQNSIKLCHEPGKSSATPLTRHVKLRSSPEHSASLHCMNTDRDTVTDGDLRENVSQQPGDAHTSSLNHTSDMRPPNFPFENTAASPSIGQDLWRQLKRVQIPVFTGEKRQYQSWKAAFLACIDSAPATGEYKLLQLRQYLSGDALKVIENLGHSATAAKERLERKNGGKRRQIAIYIEDLENFRQIRQGDARGLEKFADLLNIAIINLKEAGLHYELQDGSLYTKVQRKLPETLLARYHRWVYENGQSESVLTLRTWVIQESEFQTVATETVHGLAGQVSDQESQPVLRRHNHRAFFGEQVTIIDEPGL